MIHSTTTEGEMGDTPEMVERVARALHNERWRRPENASAEIYVWEAAPEWMRADALAYARAAIEAMREPTEAMIEAAWPHGAYNGPAMDHFKGDVADYWRASIDAALGTPK